MRWNTCRFCDAKMGDNLVKYGTRHYAHHACYLDAGKPLYSLPTHVLGQFPYFLLKERGLLEEVDDIIQSRERPSPFTFS
jgi:hypothetical protein